MVGSTAAGRSTLVSTQELEAHLQDWRVFDCRHDLMKPELGEQQYRQAHIPGALFAHLDRDLSAPRDGRNGRHPLPYSGAFFAWLGQQGVRPGDQIVCYDGSSGVTAARLWWMLRWVGHARVAVLDGGWDAWIAGGRPASAELPALQPTAYTLRPHPDLAVDAAYVASHLPQLAVLDARSAERFRGENETLDPVGGHIPGAINHFFKLNLDASGRFKPADTLKAELSEVLAGRDLRSVVHQCGSGVTACHNLLAMEHAGLTGSRLYPGSWSEWVSDRSRPVAS